MAVTRAQTGWFKNKSKATRLRVLTAAATRIDISDRNEAKRQKALRAGWQSDAWCVDPETEILTTRGWLTYGEVVAGDLALTLNQETGESEWQPVKAVKVFDVSERPMLSMQGRLHSSLSTLDHKWPTVARREAFTQADVDIRRERRHAKRLGLPPPSAPAHGPRPAATLVCALTRSDELTTRHSLITAAPCADLPDVAVYTDAFVELVAWFWTEGTIKASGAVVITQSWRVYPENVARIRAALTAVFGPAVPTTRGLQYPAWREGTDEDMAVFALDKYAGQRLGAIAPAPDKVVATGFVRSLTLAQLELFIQTSVDADGHRDARTGANVCVTQSVRARLEPLALASILTGRTPHIYLKDEGCWRLHIRDKATVNPLDAASREWENATVVKRVTYSGQVWCPMVANRTWLARRRGTVYFTGNTYRSSVPELRYAVKFLAHCCARMKLFPAVYLPGAESDEPVPLAHAEGVPMDLSGLAELGLQELGNGRMAMAHLMGDLSTNLSVAGEGWLLGRQNEQTGEEEWGIRSVDELVVTDTSWRLREMPDNPNGVIPWVDLDPDTCVISRIWTPDPRYHLLADSPVKAMLDECEAICILRRIIRATGRSRLSGRGLLCFPNEITFANEPNDDQDPDADTFIADLTKAMMAPITNEGTAESVVPLVVRGPGEFLDKIRHIDFASSFDSEASKTREELIGVIATGFDLPKEVIMGIADLNHWSAWQVSDDVFRHHVEPAVIEAVDALTGAFLRPYLQSYGVPDEWVRRCVLWYDPVELVTHPDRTADSQKAYEDMIISAEAYRKAAGFAEDDAPTVSELEMRRVMDIRALPLNLLMEYAQRFDPTLVVPPITVSGMVPGIKPGGVDMGEGLIPTQPTRPQADAGVGLDKPVSAPAPAQPGPPPAAQNPVPPKPGPPAALTAASGGASISRQLMDVDRQLRIRLQAAANAAMLRQMERAGAKMRTKLGKDETVRTKIDQRRNEHVPFILGKDAMAAAGLTAAGLMNDDWAALREQFMRWTGAAQRQSLRLIGKLVDIPQQAVDQAGNALAVQLDAAWNVFKHALNTIGQQLLSEDPAELDPDALVPVGTLRAVLSVAGGAPSSALTIDASTGGGMSGFVPQIGSGATIQKLAGVGGANVERYVWHHTATTVHPFEPHEALDGVEFHSFTDDALKNPDSFPDNAYFLPGDHPGCSCDAELLYEVAP